MTAFAAATPLTASHRPHVKATCGPRMQAGEGDDEKQKVLQTQAQPGKDEAEGGKRYQLSRRDALRLASGAALTASLSMAWRAREALRFVSPQSLLTELGLGRGAVRADTGSSSFDARGFIARRAAEPAITIADFPAGLDWLNARPLSLRNELAGKVVLLDFFTYCCVNCMHVLPTLGALERRHSAADGLVVVGVHAGKFAAERSTPNIAAALKRYGVAHPVVNDEKMRYWGALGVSSWPTLALLGPDSNLICTFVGEPVREDLFALVDAALDFYRPKINTAPLPPAPRDAPTGDGALRYPGKLALGSDGTLYVADTANHRVVQLAVDATSARVVRTFGTGNEGFDDGAVKKATFRSPQGVALSDGRLYVCDTGNHAVREVTLEDGSVRTLGGDGERGNKRTAGDFGRQQSMASPWDCTVVNDALYVAMAGTHQIWQLPVGGGAKQKWEVTSGTGAERANDGMDASWAQPSGLCYADGELYVADSESSSVRSWTLPDGPARTLAGGDGAPGGADNLFAYGDKDGKARRARFQHPLGVAYSNGALYVADTYNNRLKKVDADGRASVLAGDGRPGLKDGSLKDAQFWEPGGLVAAGDMLYVADTNNGALRAVDLARGSVSTLNVVDPTAPAEGPLITSRRRVAVEDVADGVATGGKLRVVIRLPDATHFTANAPSVYQCSVVDGNAYRVVAGGTMLLDDKAKTASFDVALPDAAGGVLEVEHLVYYCGNDDGACRTGAAVYRLPLGSGARTVVLERGIARKQPRRPVTATT